MVKADNGCKCKKKKKKETLHISMYPTKIHHCLKLCVYKALLENIFNRAKFAKPIILIAAKKKKKKSGLH